MSLQSSQSRIEQAHKQLLRTWSDVSTRWQDQVAEKVHDQFIDPLRAPVKRSQKNGCKLWTKCFVQFDANVKSRREYEGFASKNISSLDILKDLRRNCRGQTQPAIGETQSRQAKTQVEHEGVPRRSKIRSHTKRQQLNEKHQRILNARRSKKSKELTWKRSRDPG